jgi:hypothetical protein
MINSNIITDIDDVIIESEMCVIESMINSYHKALMILEHSESSDYYDIIQESSSGDNIIVKMFKAIIEFFKRIGKSISSFFNKSSDSTLSYDLIISNFVISLTFSFNTSYKEVIIKEVFKSFSIAFLN